MHGSGLVGMCAGALAGDVSAIKCYGRTGAGSSQTPDERTLFQIGSISKTFTATLLADRVAQGTVSLDTTVRSLIPAGDHPDLFRAAWQAFTDLLTDQGIEYA